MASNSRQIPGGGYVSTPPANNRQTPGSGFISQAQPGGGSGSGGTATLKPNVFVAT